MLILHNRFIPFGSYLAVNLLGVVFVKKGQQLTEVEKNHEYIHTLQQREMLYVAFYIWYVVEWLVKLCLYRNRSKAYYAISFEREAYCNMRDLRYRKKRRLFAWTRYLKST